MNNEPEKGYSGRLWSGSARPEEKIVPLKQPATEARHHSFSDPNDRQYAAFEIRDRADRLHIMCATRPSRFPNYGYLLDIVYDDRLQSGFTLIYTFMIVEVFGRHLAPVVHAISYGNCERIREFSAKLYDAPAMDEPFIDTIRVTAADERKH